MHTALGDQPRHYQRLGLTPGVIEAREDGLRTSAGEGSFEWWYLDCHLEDGSHLVITFYTKPPTVSASRPLMPFVSLLLDRPDGTHLERAGLLPPESFSAARDRCDVRIGANRFAGDLQRYEIHVELEDVVADVELVSEMAPFRPDTGHVFFGDEEQHHVAWFPAVPQARALVKLRVGGEVRELRGAAYHDHNWGNASLRRLIDHWYWARARVGEYSVVALMFVGARAFGGSVITSFMLARGGQIIAADQNRLRFSASPPAPHAATGVPLSDRLTFGFRADDGQDYSVSFSRQRDVYTLDFAPAGAYLRFAGEVLLERREGEALVETVAAPGTWELLYFGGNK